MINFTNVTKAYDGRVVLDNLSMTIESGEIVAVLGSSGAGKSTIINCLNGLVTPDSGSIMVNDLSIGDRKCRNDIRKLCATVFQNFNLYPHLTNIENITLAPIRVLRQTPDDANSNALRLLESVGLADHASKYPGQLSGGQKQRVGICRALAMAPEYLLLDEITSSLDPEMTAEVIDVLRELATSGMTMILVTHEINVARSIATRIIFLDHGKALVDADADRFFSDQFLSDNARIRHFVQKSEGL